MASKEDIMFCVFGVVVHCPCKKNWTTADEKLLLLLLCYYILVTFDLIFNLEQFLYFIMSSWRLAAARGMLSYACPRASVHDHILKVCELAVLQTTWGIHQIYNLCAVGDKD